MDILHFLKSHHEAIRAACRQLAATTEAKLRRQQLDALTGSLEAYMTLERDYLYPEIAGLFAGADQLVAIGASQASIIDKKLKALAKLWLKGSSEQAGFAAQLGELDQALTLHFDQEEQVLMPKMRALMRTEDREDLGQVFADVEAEGLTVLNQPVTGGRKRA